MNTLPEGDKVDGEVVGVSKLEVPAEQQLEMLRGMLAGHRIFGKRRGKLHWFPDSDILAAKNGNFPSPKQVRRQTHEWYADQVVMMGMLATLQREGHTVAYRELWSALRDEGYVITGEEVPLEKTKPCVLLVHDLAETLLIARWAYTSEIEDAESWIQHGRLPKEPESYKLRGSLTGQLLKQLPSFALHLTERLRSGRREDETSPSFWRGEKAESIYDQLAKKFNRNNIHCLFEDKEKNGYVRNRRALAFFITGADQSDVLSLFSREEQESLTTWRFDYPQFRMNDFGSWGSHGEYWSTELWLGLHPECEHRSWSKQWPTFASRACAQGLGALILKKDQLGDIQNQPSPFPKYVPLPGAYHMEHMKKVPAGYRIEDQRLVLKFREG